MRKLLNTLSNKFKDQKIQIKSNTDDMDKAIIFVDDVETHIGFSRMLYTSLINMPAIVSHPYSEILIDSIEDYNKNGYNLKKATDTYTATMSQEGKLSIEKE